MNTIDIIIPTMWFESKLVGYLTTYCNSDKVNKIILIDNNHTNRPSSDILKHEKISLVSYGKNIYVNPAWNEGYYRSTADVLCILNDDVSVQEDVFSMVSELDFSSIDIIGVHLKGSVDNYHIVNHPDKKEDLFRLNVNKNKPIGGQAYAFGVCMFVKRSSYRVIPSLYQVWYGDDYLVQQSDNIFSLKTSKITGEISKTIVTANKTGKNSVQKRIDLDTHNAYRYGHFKSFKNPTTPKPNENLDIFEYEYKAAQTVPSDINENVHILYELSKNCTHVTEMGVRTGVSTRAFLNSNVELISYDIQYNKQVDALFNLAKSVGKKANYIIADVLKIDIAETDLLFIDTWHIYEQLKQELKLHANKARKYIAFHDTYTFGLRGENGKDKRGLLSAIIEFMIENPHWKVKIYKLNNNGFIVLERLN